jgi:beta-N-acetylhexosaminidase
MPLTLEQAVGQKLMLSFVGTEPAPDILATLERQHVGGLTLFRHNNVANPAQVRTLADALQRAAHASGQPPLLIAADQEGGTLQAFANTTPFPGNLALGATRSEELARQAGHAIGRELAAMGINVNYAPVCDVNVNPQNSVVGPRSFGEDPDLVARLSAATVEGLQSAGVAATAKHFPGHGDTATDSHYGLPVLLHDMARLRRVELPPFAAAIRANAKLVMTAHIALPNYNGGANVPATLSAVILRGLLRGELGYAGVIISDALDMQAIQQGPGFMDNLIAAAAAGCDLLLFGSRFNDQRAVHAALVHAVQQGRLARDDVMASAQRVLDLKEWCRQAATPPLEVVGCAEHRALADEIAARALTLVRDTAQRLPLRLPSGARLAVILPRPQDLTPADTSSYEEPALASALRAYHANADEFVIPMQPSDSDVTALREMMAAYDLVVVATINAGDHPGQAALVNALLARGLAVVAVALRMPSDLQAYPSAPTYICTYSLQPPSLHALARALWGHRPFSGQLPVSIPIA